MSAVVMAPIFLILWLIDVAITIATFAWIPVLKRLLSSGSLRTASIKGNESHRVDIRYKDCLATVPAPGVDTLYEVMKTACKKYSTTRCMASREFLGWKSDKVKEFGPNLKWITYAEMEEKALKFGAALKAAGCEAAPETTDLNKVTAPYRIAIFENTCPEWMMSAVGAFTQSVTVTTVYATLGIDAVMEAIRDNVIRVIVCNKSNVQKLLANANNLPTLKYIVYTNDLVAPNDETKWDNIPKGVHVVSFEDFVESGDTEKYPPVPPKPTTTAVVMYTSGSTGKPKGVIITHQQVVAGCTAAEVGISFRENKDVYLAYLPMAHILELMCEFVVMSKGCTMTYADPKSLTDKGAYPIGALEAYSPTIMVGVPKIWDVIKKGVEAKIAATSAGKQFLANSALKWKDFAVKNGFDTPLFNQVVFKKFKVAVGGKLRMALSGGGPLNSEVQDFIRAAFGIGLIQGYGLTETCAGGTIQAIDDVRPNIAGVAIAANELKLESAPEVLDRAGAAYMVSDKFDVDGNPVFGRGEILIRGGTVASGYYQMPEKTKEVFGKDGWFYTGDIGQFMSDGSLRIVDRKKNLVKLKGGEYVALEKMEMTFGNSSFVDAVAGGICCYGDGGMDRPVALMQLSEAYTMKWAKENSVDGDFHALSKSEKVYEAVMADMKKEHTKSDLSHLEKLVAVSLLTEPWTPENGCLTAANKLQRRQVIATHAKEFEELKKKGIFQEHV